MAKASPTQAWLWHRRLYHLNFDYINLLSKKDVMIGLPKLKYVKDQLCSSCEVSTQQQGVYSRQRLFQFSKGRLNLLNMDLCGPMRVVSINGKKYILASDYEKSGPVPQLQNVSPLADTTALSQQELDLLFGPLYDEFFNAGTSSVNKSSSPTDNYKQQDTQPSMNIYPTTEPTSPKSVNADEKNKNQAADTQWTKDHPLSQVRGNLSKPVQTRRQLVTDPEICMFALIVSTAEPKTIMEAMADSAWIEAMQKELHQFDRLQVWKLVDKPFGKNVIKQKWLWKNKKDETKL
ncbi:retrovirus-related pol polyprotein from transposon TNT 1-94 [Tanacetum coccineum]